MARDISELGADVYDDTPKPQHKISPKKRNYIIGLSITAFLLAGAVVGTVILCNTALTDYSNVRNVKYYYTPKSMLEPGEEPTAILLKLTKSTEEYKYASTFRIPSKVNGYKVVGVAANAFNGHTEIKKIIMPNSIQFVGEKAFKGCTNLKSFTWSKNLTSVGMNAFDETAFYSKLQGDIIYDLPNGLCIYVGENYFKENTALVSDNLTAEETQNVKDNYGATNIIKFSDCGIKSLSDGIFKDNDKIVYVDLPEYQTAICKSTFQSCSNLQGFDASHSKVKAISERAFYECTKLKSVILGNEVTEIEKQAFAYIAITELPDISHVKTMSTGVFEGCSKVVAVDDYPLSYVPEKMFSGCSSLSSMSWENADEVTSIGTAAFEGTSFTTFVVPKNVATLPENFMKNNKKLTKVSLYGNPDCKIIPGSDVPQKVDEDDPDDDTMTEVESFIDYNGVQHQGTLIGVKSIMSSSFDNCTALKTIDLYDNDGAHWRGNEGEFTFPYSLRRTDKYSDITNKDNRTFNGTVLTKLIITPNMNNIGSYAFKDAKELVKVELDSHIADKSLFTLNRIYTNAFAGCSKLEEIEVPSSLSNLGSSAFNGCRKLTEIKNFVNTSVDTINASAFKNCSSLSHIDLPACVGSIKNNSFNGTTNLDYLVVPSAVEEIESDSFINCRERELDANDDEIEITDDSLKMKVFIDMTYEKATTNKGPFKKAGDDEKCHDDTTLLLYRLADGEQKVEGRHYWAYNSSNVPEEI